jgi:hypothetical protein
VSMNAWPLAAAAVMGVVGVLVAADVAGIATKWDTANRRWRSRGRIRRRLFPYRGTMRFAGVGLVVMAVLIVTALFFDHS